MNYFSTLLRLLAACGLLLMSGLFQPAAADVCNPADADFDPAICPSSATQPSGGEPCDSTSGTGCDTAPPDCDPATGLGCDGPPPGCDPATGAGCDGPTSGCDPATGAGCDDGGMHSGCDPMGANCDDGGMPTDCDPMTGAGCDDSGMPPSCPANDPNCPSASGGEDGMSYAAGVQAGIEQCQTDPASCGITVSGDTGELQSCATVDSQFNVSIPCVIVAGDAYEAQLIHRGNLQWNLGPVAPRQPMAPGPAPMDGGGCPADDPNCPMGPPTAPTM